jgi:hypothetical protein
VSYLASRGQLIPESVYRLFIRCNLRFDEFQCNFLFSLRILNTKDIAHPTLAQFFDDFVSFSESGSPLELRNRCFDGFGYTDFFERLEWGSTLTAELWVSGLSV